MSDCTQIGFGVTIVLSVLCCTVAPFCASAGHHRAGMVVWWIGVGLFSLAVVAVLIGAKL
jgi:hypothetical protein